MGLAASPRASFAWVALGWEWKALLSFAFPPSHLGKSSELVCARFGVGCRTRSANVPGTVRVGCWLASASALSALRSGIAKGAINAAWDAIGEVIKAWATEGHSVAVPGLGTMDWLRRACSRSG